MYSFILKRICMLYIQFTNTLSPYRTVNFLLEKPTVSLLFVCYSLDSIHLASVWYKTNNKDFEHSVVILDILFLLSHIINCNANASGLFSELVTSSLGFRGNMNWEKFMLISQSNVTVIIQGTSVEFGKK